MKQDCSGPIVRQGASESDPSVAILNLLHDHPGLSNLAEPERAKTLADLATLMSRLKRVHKMSDSFSRISINPALLTFMQSNGVA
jgi:hypothetical protein